MSEHNATAVDDFISAAQRGATNGVDCDTGGQAVQEALEALLRQTRALNAARYKNHRVKARCTTCKTVTVQVVNAPHPAEVARAATHTANVADVITRLMAFAKGQPDSRPDRGGDWLRALDDDQIKTVMGWVAAKRGKA